MALELRLYIFVPYNLSSIQKGIQAGHAALEYANKYWQTTLYRDFIRNHKTWIVLNGGTTRDVDKSIEYGIDPGTLNQIRYDIMNNEIPFGDFREPDLNYALTAVCFIADERVWNIDSYPDCDMPGSPESYKRWVNEMLGGEKNVFLRNLIRDKRLA